MKSQDKELNKPFSLVTLFDKNYALRGLALIRSLDRVGIDYVMWVVALDEYVEELFEVLDHNRVRVIPLSDIETPALEAAKGNRSSAEYYWTLSPFVFDAVFDRSPHSEVVTYVDADLWFRQSPEHALTEFESSSASILITEHAYHPAFDATEKSGRFCVQFLSARRGRSDEILSKWQQQCLDWCFAYPDNGRFGDQGYLNEWPSRYGSRVAIARPEAMFQGPWNAMRFPYGEAIAFHFHSLVYGGRGKFSVGLYPIPKPHQRIVFSAYRSDLIWAEKVVNGTGLPVFGLAGRMQFFSAFLHRMVRLRELWLTH